MTAQSKGLQQRAGKNSPGFADWVIGTMKGRKVLTNDFLLVDNSENLVLSPFFSGSSTLFNRSGNPIDFQLVLKLADGYEFLIDSGVMASGNIPISYGNLLSVPPGAKLYLRITSLPSITTGNGVWIDLNLQVASKQLWAQTFQEFVDTEIVYRFHPGILGGNALSTGAPGILFSLFNASPDGTVVVTATYTDEDGTFEPTPSGPMSANDITTGPIPFNGLGEYKVSLSNLPVGGKVYLMVINPLQNNEYEAIPT